MNFAPFNVLEFDGALPSVSIASWMPTSTQPGRLITYAAGTTLASVQIVKVIPRIPDPWRATSARPGPEPRKGAVMRDPAGIVSSPPVFAYQAPPALPSNEGYTIKSVPDPWRGTSTPLYGPQTRPFVLTPFLSWQPTVVQPGRPVLRAAGTDHVKDVWRFPEAVSADKWLSPPPQPSRQVLRAAGTTFATSPAEVIFADKWQPTTVQPTRSVIYARGTDSVLVGDPITPDKWVPTVVHSIRPVPRAQGTSFVEPVWTVDTLADLAVCEGRLTLVSGSPLGSGSGTTLYFTPHRGNLIGFQQGQVIPFSETSIAIPAPTGVYDVFAYNNSGTLALEFSSAWSTTGDGTGADGTRTNAISLTNGIYYKSSDATRRYLGTIYSASGTSYDIAGGIGTLGKRYVWNYYNRIRKFVSTIESAVSWSYGSGVWRPFNNNANALSSFKVVNGVLEDTIECMVLASTADAGTGAQYGVSVGYDQNTANSSSFSAIGTVASGTKASLQGYNFATYNIQENIGLHTFWALEDTLTGTVNVYANGNGSEIHAIHWC